MKKMLASCAALSVSAALFAYNPPAGGQSLFNLSSPLSLTSASSAAGGGIFMPGPESIAFNPALPSFEDRVQLDADFSVLGNTGDGDSGGAFQTGILIPLKMFNVTGILNGVFIGGDPVIKNGKVLNELSLGKSLNFKSGISKEVTERISVGVTLDAGYIWDAYEAGSGNSKDWSLGAGLGALYRREQLGFAKDFRVGAALLNIGKCYEVNLPGMDLEDTADLFPGFITLKTGAAANLVSTKDFLLGASFDITVPSFQDVVFSAGVNFAVKDVFYINVAENIDVMEAKNGFEDFMPAVSFSVKFNLNAKNNSYLKAHSWENSEMLASAGWQQKYGDLQVVSAGLRINLGQKDVDPPVIQIWDEE